MGTLNNTSLTSLEEKDSKTPLPFNGIVLRYFVYHVFIYTLTYETASLTYVLSCIGYGCAYSKVDDSRVDVCC